MTTTIVPYTGTAHQQRAATADLPARPDANPHAWLAYFDPYAGVKAVFDHVATLRSARTPEQHTLRVYQTGLEYFLRYLGGRIDAEVYDLTRLQLPTEARLKDYVSHLAGKRLKPATITSKYLAPIRHFLKALANQDVDVTSGGEWMFVARCKDQLHIAQDVKGPRSDSTGDLAPVYYYGNRLDIFEVNTLFAGIDRSTLPGKRDLALLFIGFTTGLRQAEILRLTRASIVRGTDTWEIHVRGKGNKPRRAPFSETGVRLVEEYIAAYNAALDDDGDPRRITPETPLWRGFSNQGGRPDKRRTGFTASGLDHMIRTRSRQAIGREISCHDMRRTLACLLQQKDWSMKKIQAVLGHQSSATTDRYVGELTNMAELLSTAVLNFVLPDLPTNQPELL